MQKKITQTMDFADLKISAAELNDILITNHYFRNCDLKAVAENIENDLLNKKYAIFTILPVIDLKDSFKTVYRVSMNKYVREDKKNERLDSINDLKYPPIDKAKNLGYNRCSFKGQSMFYGGFGNLFSIVESKPEKGDLITISKWDMKPNFDLHYVPIFQDNSLNRYSDVFSDEWEQYQEKLSTLTEVQRQAIENIYSLITFFFTRPVYNKIEYLFSSYFSNRIFDMNKEIEAILYPSVPNQYMAFNLAIKPKVFDDKFDFLEAEEHLILTDRNSSGGWLSHLVAISSGVSNGQLIWINK